MGKSKWLLFFMGLTGYPVRAQQVTAVLGDTTGQPTVSRHVYGHFAEHLGRCIYDGITRDGTIRTDVVDALRAIRVPNLRWPGGCFADEYHWRDGIGPMESRPVRLNTTWGMVEEDNSFGTHEFMELCARIGAEPYVAGNVGTGTPQEMAGWIEYLNSGSNSALAVERRANGREQPYGVSLWGVGNESWGCGGDMTPEHYANLYRQYANFCETHPGAPRLRKVAGGANADDYHWTEVCMKNIPTHLMWGLSLHYYTWLEGKWPPTGSATAFGEGEYARAMRQALRMEEIIAKHSAIMDRYDPEKKVALVVDEWGIWTQAEPGTNPAFLYQQNSLRDALIAASTLNIFHHHADRVKVANLAQAVNVLQALILTEGDRMLLTPTYHVFDLMQVHQDGKHVLLRLASPAYIHDGQSIPAVNASATVDSTGTVHVTLVNLDPGNEIEVELAGTGDARLAGLNTRASIGNTTARILTSASFTDHNTFDEPERVRPQPFTGFLAVDGKLQVTLPALSVVQVAVAGHLQKANDDTTIK